MKDQPPSSYEMCVNRSRGSTWGELQGAREKCSREQDERREKFITELISKTSAPRRPRKLRRLIRQRRVA